LEETLLKKGFFQAIFPKLLKVLGNRDPLWRGFKGKTLFQKGFPLNLMTLPSIVPDLLDIYHQDIQMSDVPPLFSRYREAR
jgi:hypothetical protein